jgi:enoyl-CoA hydratase
VSLDGQIRASGARPHLPKDSAHPAAAAASPLSFGRCLEGPGGEILCTTMTEPGDNPVHLPREVGHLAICERNSVAIVQINRPEKRNALTAAFWSNMRTVLRALEDNRSIRVIVLTGAGQEAFCAGGDIGDFQKLTTLEQKRAFQADAMRTFMAIEECSVPIIAAVNGWALGGGCELTLACDIALASDKAMFGMPESALGLVPGFGVLRAPEVIGRQMAKLMIMAGERLNAQQALQAGMVQRVVPHGDLMPAVLELADRIASNSSLAHAVGKKLINRGIRRADFDYSVEALTVLQSSDDTREGTDAFLQKRRPRFPRR